MKKIFYGNQEKTLSNQERRSLSSLRAWMFCIILSSALVIGLVIIFSSNSNKTPFENPERETAKSSPTIDPYDIKEFNQSDPRLLNYLRARHLTPPSKLAYNFKEAWYSPGGNINVIARLKKIFKGKQGGFFLEVGAFDGVGSNTLFFEMVFNWSGLLIECHPALVPKLKRAHRKAFIADVCISITDRPSMAEIISAKRDFQEYPGSSSLLEDNFFKRIKTPTQRFEVQTVPLFSILAALQIKIVDFVILDVQGIELKVLKNFPFTSVFVKVWVVEHTEHTAKEKVEIIEIMAKNGYKNHEDLGGDYLFVHDSI